MSERSESMNFVCSINEEVRKYVNSKTGKISVGGNFKSFNENWIPSNTSIDLIADQVNQGAGLCAWLGGAKPLGHCARIRLVFGKLAARSAP